MVLLALILAMIVIIIILRRVVLMSVILRRVSVILMSVILMSVVLRRVSVILMAIITIVGMSLVLFSKVSILTNFFNRENLTILIISKDNNIRIDYPWYIPTL